MAANYKKAKLEAKNILDEFFSGPPSLPIPIVEIAETHGLRVMEVDLGEYSSKIAGFTDLPDDTIYVNKNDNEKRQAFTIAHELGHHILHKKNVDNNKYSVLYRKPLGKMDPNPIEREANRFAAEILVPMQVLNTYLKRGINEPSILSQIFGVSSEVIGYRLKDAKRQEEE